MRSGLLGTCVGGAFALMAAGTPRIRDRVGFVGAYAAYASMGTLACDIASASRCPDGVREPWDVDQLTRKVFVHSVTALLEPGEAQQLREACADRQTQRDIPGLSEAGRAVLPLLCALDPKEAEASMLRLPVALQERLTAMCPATHTRDIYAPLIILLHDREDPVIPVSESRQLRDAFGSRAGVHCTEFTVFQHLDPTKGKPRPLPLVRELLRFARAIHPLFQRVNS
jgi:dienelactone hydrolase